MVHQQHGNNDSYSSFNSPEANLKTEILLHIITYESIYIELYHELNTSSIKSIYQNIGKAPGLSLVFCVCVSWFHSQGNLSSCRPQLSGGQLQAYTNHVRYKKRTKPKLGSLCLRYLFLRLGQLSFAVKKQSGGLF